MSSVESRSKPSAILSYGLLDHVPCQFLSHALSPCSVSCRQDISFALLFSFSCLPFLQNSEFGIPNAELQIPRGGGGALETHGSPCAVLSVKDGSLPRLATPVCSSSHAEVRSHGEAEGYACVPHSESANTAGNASALHRFVSAVRLRQSRNAFRVKATNAFRYAFFGQLASVLAGTPEKPTGTVY